MFFKGPGSYRSIFAHLIAPRFTQPKRRVTPPVLMSATVRLRDSIYFPFNTGNCGYLVVIEAQAFDVHSYWLT